MRYPVQQNDNLPLSGFQPFSPSDYDEGAQQLEGSTDESVARVASMLRYAAAALRERNAIEAELEQLLTPRAHPIARSVARMVVVGAAHRI